jgi:hypothetical protein
LIFIVIIGMMYVAGYIGVNVNAYPKTMVTAEHNIPAATLDLKSLDNMLTPICLNHPTEWGISDSADVFMGSNGIFGVGRLGADSLLLRKDKNAIELYEAIGGDIGDISIWQMWLSLFFKPRVTVAVDTTLKTTLPVVIYKKKVNYKPGEESAYSKTLRHAPAWNVYIANHSNIPLILSMQDGKIFGIQNSVTAGDNLRPIENWQGSVCGNSYYSLALQPGMYIRSKILRYQGPSKSKGRFRFAANPYHSYISSDYPINIHPGQLNLPDHAKTFKKYALLQHVMINTDHRFYSPFHQLYLWLFTSQ